MTIDFVVRTGAIVGLGMAVLSSVGPGTMTLGDKVTRSVFTMEVADYSTPSATASGRRRSTPMGAYAHTVTI